MKISRFLIMITVSIFFIVSLSFMAWAASPRVYKAKKRIPRPAPTMKKLPDLIVPSVTFIKVKSGKDSQNNLYWIFNVMITVKNRGNADSGPFKVLLERNVGPYGQYIKACPTCEIAVSGIKAGKTVTLSPRQFNNANNANSLFRATADVKGTVTESNETNNMNAEPFIP